MTLLAHLLFLTFAIGFITGLRSVTPSAVVAWCAHFDRLNLASTRLSFLSSAAAVAIFTLAAFTELVVDKLPKTPARTAPASLVVRFVFGALCGAAVALASAQVAWLAGAALGAAGGLCGGFVGFQVRTRLVKGGGIPDFVIASIEDAFAIASAILIVTQA
jgi:uncharacterized membrane protein